MDGCRRGRGEYHRTRAVEILVESEFLRGRFAHAHRESRPYRVDVGFPGWVEPEAVALDGRAHKHTSLDEEASRISGHRVVLSGVEVAIDRSDRHPERFRKEGELIRQGIESNTVMEGQ